MTDTYIVKVTEEEFDDEGNLTRRIITEYGFEPHVKWKTPYNPGGAIPRQPTYPDPILVGDVWPYGNGIVSYPNDGPHLVHSNQFDYGSLHSHRVGGTDRDGNGQVVG